MKPQIAENMKKYFKNRGFNSPAYQSGDRTQECLVNLDLNVSVLLDYEKETATLQTIDGMVVSTLGPFSVPTPHYREFIRQIISHAPEI